VANVVDAFVEARAVGRAKHGRDVPQILLVHVNELNALYLPALLVALREAGAAPAPLATVMADPIYAAADAWAGKGSRMWFSRTAPVTRPDGAPWGSDRETRLQRELEGRFGPRP